MSTVNNICMKKGIIFAAILFCFTLVVSAQGGGPVPPPDSSSGPIDSGAIVLLIAVVGYGYLRLNQKERATA